MALLTTNSSRTPFFLLQWLQIVLCIFLLNACVSDQNHHSHEHGGKAHTEIDSIYIDETTEEHVEEFHKPLEKPIWQNGKGAAHMKDDDTVIGMEVAGQAYALPWWILKNHHIANLTLEEQPILIALCEMCGSGMAYKATIDETRLNFVHQGIYKGTWFMRDRETNSFWLPFEGKSFYGDLKDSVLTNINTYQMDWKDWLEENPDTMVPYDSQSQREGHGSKDYLGSAGIEDIFRQTLPDSISTALPIHDIILGVDNHGVYKAYSMKDLDAEGKVLQDTLFDGSTVVVFHKPNTTMAGAFVPIIEGQSVSFMVDNQGDIRDEQTNSRWNYFGECVEGKLQGIQLSSHFFIVKEWYGWYGYHPSTEVFERK